MTVDTLCGSGGVLIGMTSWLPSDPAEHFVARPDWVGCNRLFCSSCRAWVRHLDNTSLVAVPASAQLERLYVDPKAAQDATFRRSLTFRTYLCRCECVEVSGIKRAGELERIDSWACAGHPPPTLDEPAPWRPTSEAEAEKALRSSAAGPPAAGDLQPWDHALRWGNPFLFRAGWPVITKLLVDPDPLLRTRTLELVGSWNAGDSATIDRLISLATQYASLFQDPPLRALLATTLVGKALSLRWLRPKIASAIVALLAGEPPPTGTSGLLAEYEPDAVIASAGRWTASDEDQRMAVSTAGAIALYRRDHLLKMLAALSARSVPEREAILQEVTGELAYPDDDLRSILETDGVPFPQTHPTVDACRSALGLP